MILPKVSIFIPLYNSENTIGETIKSLLSQSYKNFELIISDNQSTDNSIKIINDFKDSRIKIISTKSHLKIDVDNWNRCINLSDNLYTALLHSDDIYHTDFIKDQLTNILSDETIAISFTEGQFIDIHGKILKKINAPKEMINKNFSFWDIYPLILKNYNFLITPSLFFRTQIFKKKNFYFDYSKFKTSNDLALWLKISQSYKISVVRKNLISVRLSSKQGSSKVRNKIYKSDFFLVLDKYNSYFSFNKKNTSYVNFYMKNLISRDNLRILCNLIFLNERKIVSDDFSDVISLNIVLKSYKKKYISHLLVYLIIKILFLSRLDNLNYRLVSYLKRNFLI